RLLLYSLRRRPPRSPLFPSTTLFRSAGGDGADAVRNGIGVSADHLYRLHRYADGISGDLREYGAVALSLGGGSQRQSHSPVGARSEEHTSELQSRENLVCRLLLEKKN